LHTAGKLTFQEGETVKSIEIPLINDNAWGAALTFAVELLDEGLVGAVLGRYLWRATINIIDNDLFPSNRYGDLLLEKDWDDRVPQSGLLKE